MSAARARARVRVPGTVSNVVATARDRHLPFLAATLAHYALASLVPLFVLAFALVSIVDGGATMLWLVDRLGPYVSPAGERVLQRSLRGAAGRAGASAVGLAFLVWGALRVFRALSYAFARIYDAPERVGLREQLSDGVVVLTAVLLALVALVAASLVVALVDLPVRSPRLVGTAVLLAVLVVLFFPVYYVMPPLSVSVREALPGTVLVALGWVVLQAGFVLYVRHAGEYQAYGLLGAALLLVTWLYLGSALVLVGAVVNVVLARSTPLARLYPHR